MPEMLVEASAVAQHRDVAPETAAFFNCAAALGEAIGPAGGGVAFAFGGFGAAAAGSALLSGLYVPPLLCVLHGSQIIPSAKEYSTPVRSRVGSHDESHAHLHTPVMPQMHQRSTLNHPTAVF